MRPGKVAVICIATVVGVNFLAHRSPAVRRVWAS